MGNFSIVITFLNYILIVSLVSCSTALKPRGVAFDKTFLYIPDKDFSCLDGNLVIPFSHVNDDYCDCPDASDEPGTSACPNGTFHCINTGHTSAVIPSSRVNDGICDCCDGSDEWIKQSTCSSTCEELGRAAKEEAERVHQLYVAGYEIREQLIAKGKELKAEKQARISTLLEEEKIADLVKNNTLIKKLAAEEVEKIALEKYRIMDEEKKKQEKEKEYVNNQNEAFAVFNEIDTNNNNKIEEEEVNAYTTFDQNKDGIVSQDEKEYFMEDKKELSLEDFISNGWNRLKQLLFTQSIDKSPIEQSSNEKQFEDEVDDLHENDNEEDNEQESIDDEVEHISTTDEIDESQYDEETKLKIIEAKNIRELFEEAERKVRNIQQEISQLQESLNKDYGPEDEFAALDRQCFELSDHEYVYKLCLFDKVTQQSKNGGPEVRLGNWNGWIGEQKYRTMVYDKGQHCWNGPQRSTHVSLNCGLEPALISVTEPNRCEYAMDFVMPAACVKHNERPSAPIKEESEHDEL
ncbi:glucosidase 2 subunit beta-like [Adelges cooleyi]|uniref:glucosidase 2 subunit beta-like n=1 Tax=Adelges cooleyi TaxID=133065 RepID=UPI00217F9C33|nr:glucosidase 2 subunit beta-like [Adelges cooleyi]